MAAPLAIASSGISLLGGIAGMGASAAGAGIQAQAAQQKGEADATALLYQRAIALRNRDIMKQNADYQRQAGEIDAQRSGLKTGFEIALQKAGQGAGNLDVNFGSNKQVRESTHQVGWQDQLVIRSEASRRAYAMEQEAVTEGIKAEMYERAATDARKAGGLNASASILGGITSVASKWQQMSMYGSFGGSGGSTSLYGSGGAASP